MRDGARRLLTSGHFRHLLYLYDPYSLPWRVKQAAYFSPDVLVPSPHTLSLPPPARPIRRALQ